jgi:hypothetical protein
MERLTAFHAHLETTEDCYENITGMTAAEASLSRDSGKSMGR